MSGNFVDPSRKSGTSQEILSVKWILCQSIVELYQCQISFIEFEMQACNLECEHAICNSKMSIRTADLEDVLSNINHFKLTEIVIKL